MSGKIDPGLGELLRHLIHLVDGGAEDTYRRKGLAYRPRYTPLMRVLADGARTINEITSHLSISQGAVSQTVKLMEDDGLVVRGKGRDGRQVVIALSDVGKSLLSILKAHWAATFRAIEDLEDEVGLPLRPILSRTILALEEKGFAQRIEEVEAGKGKTEDHSTRVRGLFLNGGKDYAQYRPSYPAELAQALAAMAPARGGAIDVGCGSGQLSVLLAEHFDAVIGTDISPDQLAHAGGHRKVTYRCEAAETMSMEERSADLIVAAQAAHWFDLPRFYGEIRRVARPGAVVALISYGVPCLEGAVNAGFQRFYWRELFGYWPPQRRHVENGYAELPFPFEELAPPPALVIQQNWDLEQMMGYLRTWSAVRRMEAEGQRPRLRRFEEEFAALWGAPVTARRITWPITVRAGRVNRHTNRDGAVGANDRPVISLPPAAG